MTTKKYSTIVADPPWYQRGGGKCKRGADKHYPIMKEHEIKKIMSDVLAVSARWWWKRLTGGGLI
jgi:23S rRNA G2069 N7-methylase RlmK/C1962 C5-methylase RlmI